MSAEITDKRVSVDWLVTDGRLKKANVSRPLRSHWTDWAPLALLPGSSLLLRNRLPDWVFMFVIVFAIYTSCKWLTWRRALAAHARPSFGRSLAYLLAWPGMNAREFLRPGIVRSSFVDKAPTRGKLKWVLAAAKTFTGAGLLWFAAQNSQVFDPLLIGWIGMIGLVLFLHFGVFELIAFGWQSAGVDAKPLMREPLRAVSVAEFWGSRWNTAFNALVHDLAFRQFVRRLGIRCAIVGVFLISGFVHEMAISVPGRGGYGLPTAYFLLQACGLLLERSPLGRRFGLGCGLVGRWFVFICVGAPLFWLFHPPFVTNVILPMLRAIGGK